VEQSADAITANLACGMKPTKESDAAEPFGQDMLEITADEFGGLQWDGLVLSGVGIAIGPEYLARRQPLQLPIAGGRFEDVTGQVGQSVLARTDGLAIHHPG
jgi:hypothetical protein